MSTIKYLLRGDFVSDIKKKHLRVMIFFILLAMFLISISNRSWQKRYEIDMLKKEVKHLKSNYIDINMRLIKIYNSNEFKRKLKELGLKRFDYRNYNVMLEDYKSVTK